MRLSEKTSGLIADEEHEPACFGRIEMPWENLQTAADRGLLFTDLKKYDASLGYVSAIVRVSDRLCDELCTEQCSGGAPSPMNLYRRQGEELYRIASDLSCRTDQELASDEIFCEWQISIRNGFQNEQGDPLRDQEAARWSFKGIQADPDELEYFVEALARVRLERVTRSQSSSWIAAETTDETICVESIALV